MLIIEEMKLKVAKAKASYQRAVKNLHEAIKNEAKQDITRFEKVKKTAKTKLINAQESLREAKTSAPGFIKRTIKKVPLKKTAMWTGLTAGIAGLGAVAYVLYERLVCNGDEGTSDQV